MHPRRPLIIHYPKPVPFDVLCNYFDKCDIEDKLQRMIDPESVSGQGIKFKSEKWTVTVLEPVKTSITQIMEIEEIKRQEEIKKEIKRQEEIKKKESRFTNGWTTVKSKNKW